MVNSQEIGSSRWSNLFW